MLFYTFFFKKSIETGKRYKYPLPHVHDKIYTNETNGYNMARFRTHITSFTIAHYILLFLVCGLCIGIIAWIMISRHNATPTNNVQFNISHINKNMPCVQRTTETINQMWKYDPKMVPQKYWDIAMDYLNQVYTVTTFGICNDIGYVCRIGQTRRDCDPCAVPLARKYAQEIHLNDEIAKNCFEN